MSLNIKKSCCVALSAVLAVSLCACKKDNAGKKDTTTETVTTIVERTTTQATEIWYKSVQTEINQKQNLGYVYRVKATNTRVYNTEGNLSDFLSFGDEFVTDGELGFNETVKIWYKNQNNEVIEGFVVFDEKTKAEYYEFVG